MDVRGLAADCPISRIFTPSLDDNEDHMVCNILINFITFILFQAMGGILSSKGFPEQFDDLCHISVKPRGLS